MKLFEMNGLGENWRWQANTAEEATIKFLKEFQGSTSKKEYRKYCLETTGECEVYFQEVHLVDNDCETEEKYGPKEYTI